LRVLARARLDEAGGQGEAAQGVHGAGHHDRGAGCEGTGSVTRRRYFPRPGPLPRRCHTVVLCAPQALGQAQAHAADASALGADKGRYSRPPPPPPPELVTPARLLFENSTDPDHVLIWKPARLEACKGRLARGGWARGGLACGFILCKMRWLSRARVESTGRSLPMLLTDSSHAALRRPPLSTLSPNSLKAYSLEWGVGTAHALT
jgi:hypothetical protein